MTKNKELFYWQSDTHWYTCDEDGENITLTDSAPERAKASFEMWQAWEKHYSEEKI